MTCGQPIFWDLHDRYDRLSAVGDALQELNAISPWFILSEAVDQGAERPGGSQGRASALSR